MGFRFALIGTAAAVLAAAQIPNAPNTQPKPVNDPTNTSNITSDPTIPGSIGSTPGSNPGIGSNPGAGLSDQLREASDQVFATHLAYQTLAEVKLNELVSAKGASDAVKDYASQRVESNRKMNERLKRVASRGNITIPGELDAKHQSRIDKLANLSGPELDRAFLHDEVQYGERNLKAFEQEIQNGLDVNLKTLATRATPELQKQLQDAKDLEKSNKAK